MNEYLRRTKDISLARDMIRTTHEALSYKFPNWEMEHYWSLLLHATHLLDGVMADCLNEKVNEDLAHIVKPSSDSLNSTSNPYPIDQNESRASNHSPKQYDIREGLKNEG